MKNSPEKHTQQNKLVSGRRIGLGLVGGSLLVGYMDMTNQTYFGNLDVHPVYYAPIVVSGLTLAASAILGKREQGDPQTTS